jgi:release factor glutamine methyltransferase
MPEFHQLPSRDDQPSELWQHLNLEAEARARNASSAQMPSLDHLSLEDFNHVYEPAADTFLLIDALKYEIDQGVFDKLSNPLTVLEIGCGSGVPTIVFCQEWQNRQLNEASASLLSYVTDINLKALSVTHQTALANGIIQKNDRTNCHVIQEFIQCDLASPLLHRGLQGKVDVLIFNPPYVPTKDEEVGICTGIEASWAGGINGRRVIDLAMPQVTQLLSKPTGVAYWIVVDDNLPEEVADIFRQQYNLDCQPLLRRRAHNERLTVLKIARK